MTDGSMGSVISSLAIERYKKNSKSVSNEGTSSSVLGVPNK
jgi:hypothetical protein